MVRIVGFPFFEKAFCTVVRESFALRAISLRFTSKYASKISIAEFERDLISERTQAGLKAARSRGRLGGRPKGLSGKAKSKAVMAAALYRDPKTKSIEQILKHVNISRAPLYSYLRYEDVGLGASTNKKKSSDTTPTSSGS